MDLARREYDRFMEKTARARGSQPSYACLAILGYMGKVHGFSVQAGDINIRLFFDK